MVYPSRHPPLRSTSTQSLWSQEIWQHSRRTLRVYLGHLHLNGGLKSGYWLQKRFIMHRKLIGHLPYPGVIWNIIKDLTFFTIVFIFCVRIQSFFCSIQFSKIYRRITGRWTLKRIRCQFKQHSLLWWRAHSWILCSSHIFASPF